jgi:hypothetical protein
MDKRYQVFVSSTYADLKDARRAVLQALMEMDCIPAGMELFPATDEAQWEFIKKIIDDCDYYVVIIGGRYGSTTSEGLSYTEKEYDYAVERGLKVLGFVHGAPDEIPKELTDGDPALRDRLEAFRGKVSSGRLVKLWTLPADLPGIVALSLMKTIKSYPAIGWVRGDQVASKPLLEELNHLRKRNGELEAELRDVRAQLTPVVADIADLDELTTVRGTYYVPRYGNQKWEITIRWRELFAVLGPYLLNNPEESHFESLSAKSLCALAGYPDGAFPKLNEQDFMTFKIQFAALGLTYTEVGKSVQGGGGVFWYLTDRGRATLTELRSVRKSRG